MYWLAVRRTNIRGGPRRFGNGLLQLRYKPDMSSIFFSSDTTVRRIRWIDVERKSEMNRTSACEKRNGLGVTGLLFAQSMGMI